MLPAGCTYSAMSFVALTTVHRLYQSYTPPLLSVYRGTYRYVQGIFTQHHVDMKGLALACIEASPVEAPVHPPLLRMVCLYAAMAFVVLMTVHR